jgi:hypothetical protein
LKLFHCCLLIGGCLLLSGAARAAQEAKNAEELVARMEAMAGGLQDYQVTGEGESRGKHTKFTLYFKKPDLVRIDTDDGQVAVQPNGDIRGRLGRGPFGSISRKVDRSDKRLRDSEGIAFWESHYPAMVARIRAQLKAGAAASMSADGGAYNLEIRSGETTWKYVVDKNTLFPKENSRWVNGRQEEITRYSGFRANTGMKTGHFKF